MKRPVTSTPASEAKNSTVVSLGFPSLISFLANLVLFPEIYCTNRNARSQRVICIR
jgi:hypothetical protein